MQPHPEFVANLKYEFLVELRMPNMLTRGARQFQGSTFLFQVHSKFGYSSLIPDITRIERFK